MLVMADFCLWRLCLGLGFRLPMPKKTRLKVVTTFTVLADMARNVAGDAAEVVSITKPGAEIHGYEPTPRRHRRAPGRRPDPVERSEPRAVVRAVPRQSRRRAVGHPVSDGIEPISISGGRL